MMLSSMPAKIARITTIAMIFGAIALELTSWPVFAFVMADALAGSTPKIGLLAYLLVLFSPLILILILVLLLFWTDRHREFYPFVGLILAVIWAAFFLVKKPSVIRIAEVYTEFKIQIFASIISSF